MMKNKRKFRAGLTCLELISKKHLICWSLVTECCQRHGIRATNSQEIIRPVLTGRMLWCWILELLRGSLWGAFLFLSASIILFLLAPISAPLWVMDLTPGLWLVIPQIQGSSKTPTFLLNLLLKTALVSLLSQILWPKLTHSVTHYTITRHTSWV